MHPFPDSGVRGMLGCRDPPHLSVGWPQSAVSLHFALQTSSMPGAVLKPEVTSPLACSWWEDAAAP